MSTPNRSLKFNNAKILEESFKLKDEQKKIGVSLYWGLFNIFLLAALIYDASYDVCPTFWATYYGYFEYMLIVFLSINVLYHLKVILTYWRKRTTGQPLAIETPKISPQEKEPRFNLTPKSAWSTSSTVLSPVKMIGQSWRSSTSSPKTDSYNGSVSSPSWVYHKGGSQSYPSPYTTFEISCRNISDIEFISDEEELEQYIKEFETSQNLSNRASQSPQPTSLLSSFWSHPIAKTARDMSTFLRKCQYQLAAPSPTSPLDKTKEDKSPSAKDLSETVWSSLDVDNIKLTRWTENLRKWILQTILERLAREFDLINESLEKQGMSDIKIGAVGLDRLRKTAQMAHIINYSRSLATLIPFLEVTPNQEYLVKRIRDLARGGCMSEFKWNAGGRYNGKDWDDSLPTDSQIIMHLLAAYLDTQLMPLPNAPDVKPFTGFHYIRYKEKIPELTPTSLYIQQTSEKPPHFRVIVGNTIHDMVQGYNNLFHTILFFLYNVWKKEDGMLGRVYLGKSGLNMLAIIEN